MLIYIGSRPNGTTGFLPNDGLILPVALRIIISFVNLAGFDRTGSPRGLIMAGADKN